MSDDALAHPPSTDPTSLATPVGDVSSSSADAREAIPGAPGLLTRLQAGRSEGPPSRRVEAAWTIAFWVVAVAVLGLVLWWARYASWWADDWMLIFDRLDWSVNAIFSPHWGHPVIAPTLLWKTIISTVGLNSYLPFLALVGIAHILVAGATFHIVRRLAGAPVGFGAGLLILLLGSGGQAIVVPAALNLTGALAAGLWALAIYLDRPTRRGLIAITVLLLLAVSFSGAGLYLMATIGLLALLQPGRRAQVVTVLPALLAFLAWRWTFDRAEAGAALTKATPQQLVDFVVSGASDAIGKVTGLGTAAGLSVLVLLGAATAWHLVGRRPLREAAIAGLVGIVAVYGITGLARATIVDPDGTQASDTSRYVYLAAPFLLIACAGWLQAREPRLASVRVVLPIATAIAVAILINLPQLPRWGRFVTDQGDNARALIAILQEHAGSPALPLDAPPPPIPDLFMGHLPTTGRLLDVVAKYGSPLDPDPLTPDRPPLRPETLERVLIDLVRPAFVVTPDAAVPLATGPAPAIVDAVDAGAATSGSCVTVTPKAGAPVVTLQAPSGSTLAITGPEGGALTASISGDGTFSTPDPREAGLHAERAVLVALPDLDATWPWSVRLTLPDTGPSSVCATETPA